MSRSTFDVREPYTGAGNDDTYTFDFKIEAASQLLVVVYDTDDVEVERTTGDVPATWLDSVEFDAIEGGGTVTLNANLTTGYKLVLLLANDEPTQDYEFKNKGDFTLSRIERALDFVVGPVQRLAYLAERSLKLPDFHAASVFDMTLPVDIVGAESLTLCTNADGDGLTTGPSLTTITAAVSAVATTAASAAAAATSATAAATSATAAATSATAAATSATAAATSASTATTQATNAATSATAAQTAETNAETAEANAETAEANAAASATAAAASETAAAASATAADSSEAAAASSAADAAALVASVSGVAAQVAACAASELASAASATAAAASATAAAASATASAGSATTATTQATSATASAAAAAVAETNAETAEANAETAETNATASATAAQTAETNAETAETNAAASAAAAATSATNASASAAVFFPGSDTITNLSVACSVAANALTIAFKTQAGANASAGDPIKINFRNATLATGTFLTRTVSAALSTVISSGSTAGHTSGKAQYLYVYAIDNAGTVEVAWSSKKFAEGTLVTTVAEGGAGGADAAITMFSTTTRTSVPFRLVCRLKSNQVTAGTWALVPTEITPVPFAVPSMSLRYVPNVGAQAINTGGTPEIIDFDLISHHVGGGTVTTGASWKFTADDQGTYDIDTAALYASATFTATNATRLHVYKNGSIEASLQRIPIDVTAAQQPHVQGSLSVRLLPGDYVDIRTNHDEGTDRSLVAGGLTSYTYVAIKWAGDYV